MDYPGSGLAGTVLNKALLWRLVDKGILTKEDARETIKAALAALDPQKGSHNAGNAYRALEELLKEFGA